jgi:hypothetical protein
MVTTGGWLQIARLERLGGATSLLESPQPTAGHRPRPQPLSHAIPAGCAGPENSRSAAWTRPPSSPRRAAGPATRFWAFTPRGTGELCRAAWMDWEPVSRTRSSISGAPGRPFWRTLGAARGALDQAEVVKQLGWGPPSGTPLTILEGEVGTSSPPPSAAVTQAQPARSGQSSMSSFSASAKLGRWAYAVRGRSREPLTRHFER